MTNLTDLLHMLLCDKSHCYNPPELLDRKPYQCYYYIECDIADGHLEPDHITWEAITEEFKLSLEFSSDQEALEFVQKCLKTTHELHNFCDSKSRWEFLIALLKDKKL